MKTAMSSRLFAALLVCICPAAPAGAQQGNSWVSGTGNDANTCARDAPCRTLARAYDQTTAGGTIGVLDSADLGPINIRKAISLVAHGAEGLVRVVDDQNAIVIDVGTNDIVTLDGLIVDGGGGIYNSGISIVQAGAIHIQNCVIRGFAGATRLGILYTPNGTGSELHISDTVIANNGAAATGGGLSIRPRDRAGANVVLNRVSIQNNGFGIKVDGTATTGIIAVSVLDSVSAGNSDAGIHVTRASDPMLNVMIDSSAFVSNGASGVYSYGASATVRMGNSTVTGNITGINASNRGKVVSYGTNRINGNRTEGAPTSTITTQ